MSNGTYTIQCACGEQYAAIIAPLFRVDESARKATEAGWRVSTVCGERQGGRWSVRSHGHCPSCAARIGEAA